MSRREFLKNSTLVLGAPLVATAATRLYGAPASVIPREIADLDKFKLPLARAGVPTELWDSLARVGDLWDRVLTDSAEAQRFQSDTAGYMNSLGLDGSDATLADESLRMLQVMTDPEAKKHLANGDYVSLFGQLTAANVFEPLAPSALETKIVSLFAENYAEMSAAIDAATVGGAQENLLTGMQNLGLSVTEADLMELTKIVSASEAGVGPHPDVFALVVVAVGISAIAAAYISVVIAVTVVLLAGISISAAISSAILVCGPRSCFHPYGSAPPFTGTYAKLEPAMIRNLDRSLRLAALTRDGNIEIQAIRSVIASEVSAVFGALKQVNLIHVEDENMPKIIDAVTAYSWRALGIPTSV